MPQIVLQFKECGAKCQTCQGMPSLCPTEFAQDGCASVSVPHGRLDLRVREETCMHLVHGRPVKL